MESKGGNVLVCSEGDLFGDQIPEWWIKEVLYACEDAPKHRYFFLSNNPKRYLESLPLWKRHHNPELFRNFWFGTTITSEEDIKRAWELLRLPKDINTFLSIEPLLGSIDLNKYELLLKDWRNKKTIGKYLDWVIVGTKSEYVSATQSNQWIENIIEQTKEAAVPLFLRDNLSWHKIIKELPDSLNN